MNFIEYYIFHLIDLTFFIKYVLHKFHVIIKSIIRYTNNISLIILIKVIELVYQLIYYEI